MLKEDPNNNDSQGVACDIDSAYLIVESNVTSIDLTTWIFVNYKIMQTISNNILYTHLLYSLKSYNTLNKASNSNDPICIVKNVHLTTMSAKQSSMIAI